MANGAIFTAIIKQCPFLDRFVYIYYDERIMSKNANGDNNSRYDHFDFSLDMQFDTIKVSSFYRDHGVLGRLQ